MAITDFLSKEAVANGWAGTPEMIAKDHAAAGQQASMGGGMLGRYSNNNPGMPTNTGMGIDYSTMSNEDLAGKARTNEAQMMAQTDITNPNVAWREKLAKVNLADPNIDMDWVKGFELAASRSESNTRLGMDQQKMGAALTDRFEGRALLDGMKAAAQTGGYNGVIDYLSVTDPEKAIKFHKEKLELDASIMQNDVMQTLVPTQKAKAMVEGYGALGKMGYALLNAKPNERAEMYKQMLPMIKTVNPNAPDSLDDKATGMFMLASSQAQPENILFGEKQNQAIFKTELGRLAMARQQALKSGNLDLARDLSEQYNGVLANSKKSEMALAESALDVKIKEAKLAGDGSIGPLQRIKINQQVSNDILKANKNDITSLEEIGKLTPLMDIIMKKGINSPDAQFAAQQFRKQFNRTTEKGPQTEQDYLRSATAVGGADFAKRVEGWLTGQVKSLTAKEFNQMAVAAEHMQKSVLERMKTSEDDYSKMYDGKTYKEIVQDPNTGETSEKEVPVVDFNKLPLPSKRFRKSLVTPTDSVFKLQSQRDAALQAGKDPVAVQAMYEQQFEALKGANVSDD